MSFHQHHGSYRPGPDARSGTGFAHHDRNGERIDFGHTAHRWLTWLKTRPTECWLFFAAGLVLGGIVM
jgi:hypothetical protein